jgi:hypothetical protein
MMRAITVADGALKPDRRLGLLVPGPLVRVVDVQDEQVRVAEVQLVPLVPIALPAPRAPRKSPLITQTHDAQEAFEL